MGSGVVPKAIGRKAYGALQRDGLDATTGGLSLVMMAVFFIDIMHAWAISIGMYLR